MTLKMTVEVTTLADLGRAVELMKGAGVDVESTGFTFSRRHGGSLIIIEPKGEEDGESEPSGDL
ncbi:hypothetical protein LCGC14_0391770 [marine sediment metagenome]|uniref:Uncharacterized protein n=1 Tax=marine sediment metagenome TaxID=412755 RepID=A0A0F9VLM1_9ZZZZ